MAFACSHPKTDWCNCVTSPRCSASARNTARNFGPIARWPTPQQSSRIKGHTVHADGGAFRSKDKWYALSYTCTAAPDHLKVTSFKYKVGDEIPEAKWKEYGLWD